MPGVNSRNPAHPDEADSLMDRHLEIDLMWI